MLTKTGKLLLFFALACLLAMPAQAATGTRSGIAATVNDDVITFSDIESRLNMYLAGQKGTPPSEVRRKLMLQVLDKLINERLEMQEAKKLGITVGEEQVKDGFAHIAKQNNFTAEEFRKRLSASGVKIATLHDQIRAEIAWAQVVRRKLRPQVSVSEAEIDTAVEQMSKGRAKKQFHVAEILLSVASADTEALVRREAEKIVDAIRKGASFPKIARDVSQAPGAAQGGDLGWVRQGTLDKALDEALGAMRPGEVSAPIRTAKGYHILFLRNVHEGASAPAAAAAPQPVVPPALAAPAAAPKSETIVHLRQIIIPIAATDPAPVATAKISRAASLKNEITSCAEMEKKSKDFLTPGTGDLGRGPLSQLPEPLRKAVSALPVGTLSEPVRGDNGVAVLMVCDRQDVAVADAPAEPAAPVAEPAPAPAPETAAADMPVPPPADDQKFREEVANQIGMKRLEQMQEHYLRDLRAAAFIEKRL